MVRRRDNRPSMRDVAAHAGVSTATVSYVLNGRDRVAPATRERVLRSVEELGFVVNLAARTMRSGTRGFGISVGDLRSSFDVDVVRGAQAAARDRGATLLIGNGDGRGHLDYVEQFDQARLSGMIVCDVDTGPWMETLHRRQMPHVVVNFRGEGDEFCSVLMDNVDVGYQAAKHLIGLGCRKLAWITDGHLQPLNDRLEGINRAVSEAQGVTVEVLIASNIYESGGREIGAELAQRDSASMVDGVIAGTGLQARGFINELQSTSQWRVPDDILLVATDGNRLADAGPVRLSRISEPAFEMGFRALELLAAEVEADENHAHRRVVLSGRIDFAETSLGREVMPASHPEHFR